MFHVVEMTAPGTFVPVCDPVSNNPLTYETGTEAAKAASDLTEKHGRKFQPRRVAADKKWREREQARFDDGTYKVLPWADAPWWINSEPAKNHFAHVSLKAPGKVAFTENDEKGGADIQTPLKAGRYLQRFFGDILDHYEIRDWAMEFANKHENNVLLIAETAEEMVEVYERGPHSCMSSDFSSFIHPVTVYAAGDLALAYMKDREAITARSLIWPAKKTYGRLYGDMSRLRGLLEAAGYSFGMPDGARVKRIPCEANNGYDVMPYIDAGKDGSAGCMFVEPFDDHYIIRKEWVQGCYVAGNTNGLRDYYTASEDNSRYQCPRCGDGYDDDDDFCHISDRDESWCESCTDNYAFWCDGFDDRFSDSEGQVETAHGRTWSIRYYDRYGFTCEGNGQIYHRHDRVILADGTEWSRDYFDGHGFTCQRSGENYDDIDLVIMANGEHWSQEAFEEYGFTCKGDGQHYPIEDQDSEHAGYCVAEADKLREAAEERESALMNLYGLIQTETPEQIASR